MTPKSAVPLVQGSLQRRPGKGAPVPVARVRASTPLVRDVIALMTPASKRDLRDYGQAMLTAFRVPDAIRDPQGFIAIQCAMLMRKKYPATILAMAFEDALEQESELPSTSVMVALCEENLRAERKYLMAEWEAYGEGECPL